MQPQQTSIRRAMLVRHYLNLAEANSKHGNEFSNFLVTHMLHEALEASLIAVCDIIGAKTNPNSNILQLIEAVESNREFSIAWRNEALRFNRARVSAKHALTLPSTQDFKEFTSTIPVFCRQLFSDLTDIELDSANLIGLIENHEVRQNLRDAEQHVNTGCFYEALIEVRKAFYTKFEAQFDISPFEGKDANQKYGIFDKRSMCRAPAHAKSNSYIAKYVSTPLDYIVLDMSYLENECLKNGASTIEFWNVWRLTPAVFKTVDGSWKVREEVAIKNSADLAIASYVLETLVKIILTFQSNQTTAKYKDSSGLSMIKANIGAKVYTKCTLDSEIERIVDEECALLSTDTLEPSLTDETNFWRVIHFKKGATYFAGFLHESEADGELFEYDPSLIGLEPRHAD